LLALWFTVSVLLAAWTLFLQAYIYSEPVEQVYWRAPAAGAALALFFGLWVGLACKYPGRYDVLFQFSDTQTEKPFKELIAVTEGKENVFQRSRDSAGRLQYRRGNRILPSRPEKIIAVSDNGERTTFIPDTDAAGHYQLDASGRLRYWDSDRKRWMAEGFLGEVETFHPGWLFGNLLLNFSHLLIWFLALWLLLQFQWPHALGQAFVFWLVTMVFVVPPLLERATLFAQTRAG
jgi:hypothetical protein